MRKRGPLIACLWLLASLAWLAPDAGANAYLPPGNHVWAGLTGGSSIDPYQRMVGKHPAVFEEYTTWNRSTSWLRGADREFRSRLGLEISTSTGYGRGGVITPAQIALGRSDRFLVGLNGNLASSGRIVYVRLMGEMDAYWNAYSAFSANGLFRGPQNSPRAFVQAWRRTVLIVRGGPVGLINYKLRRLGLPAVRVNAGRRGRLPRPKVAFLWVPQDAGSPQIAADAPGVYWPGGDYVDWVGTDFYGSYPNFSLLNQFYDEFRGKPFVFGEWALYGADSPGFVRSLFGWVARHPRVRMLNYYQGFTASGPANLRHYPASRGALRRAVRSSRFLAYPPEYARAPKPGKPRGHKHHKPAPPHNPNPGPPPSNPPVVTGPHGPPLLCVPLTKICLPL